MMGIKAFGELLMPMPAAGLLIAAGLLLLRAGLRKWSHALIWTGTLILLAAGLGPVSDALLHPLESRYPATLDASTLRPAPQFIAVLGSGYRARAGWPVTAALGADAMTRLSEGLRLFRQLPGSTLILSGGTSGVEQPAARGYVIAAVALGVPSTSIIVNDTPVDTAAEIRAIRSRVGSAPVLLVTDAFHMPRAMAHCARLGVHAIAAPTGNLAEPVVRWRASWVLPSGASLHKTELAVHEYLGLLALELGIG